MKSRIQLRTILNIVVAFKAMFIFLMGYEVLGPLYSIGFLVLILTALLIEWRGFEHPPRLLINLTASAALLVIFTRVSRYYVIEALMEALLLMIAVKMLEKKRARDYVQIVALGLGTIVSYSIVTFNMIFIVHGFGLAFASTIILLLSTWLDKDESATVSLVEIRQLFVRAGAIFCLMVPLCILLFFGLPRTGQPFLGTRGAFGGTSIGFSNQVRLGDSSNIRVSRRLAFRAEMEELEYPQIYWRGAVLDVFNGNVWMASRNSPYRGPFVPDPNARRVEQVIFLEPGHRGNVFAIDHPFSISGVETLEDGDGVFRTTPAHFGQRIQFRAVSTISSHMRPLSGQINRERFLALPNNFMPRLEALVADIVQGYTDAEKTMDIMMFLSSPEFTYSLEELPYGRDALERFIFEDRRGHCEFFASAMAVMLRMAGVPSRLVTGYLGGTYNRAGGFYVVHENNAHVWVEAWDEALGAWVRHDPTPIGEVGAFGVMSILEMYLDYLDHQWLRFLTYNVDMQLGMAQNLRGAMRNPLALLTPTHDGLRRIGDVLSSAAAFLAALAVCMALFYAARSIKNRRPEIVLLHKFLRVMRRKGYSKHESEGLSEFLERVGDIPLRAAAIPFVREFEELYFKDAKIDTPTRKRLSGHIDAIARK